MKEIWKLIHYLPIFHNNTADFLICISEEDLPEIVHKVWTALSYVDSLDA